MDNKLLSTLLISITFLTLCPRITSSFSGASVRGGVNPSNHFSNRHRRSHTYSSRPPVGFNQFTSPCRSATEARASLYDDFTTSDGDVINPYDVLNIDKSATRSEVRQSYRCLCKQYHPDRVKFFETLPDKWCVYHLSLFVLCSDSETKKAILDWILFTQCTINHCALLKHC